MACQYGTISKRVNPRPVDYARTTEMSAAKILHTPFREREAFDLEEARQPVPFAEPSFIAETWEPLGGGSGHKEFGCEQDEHVLTKPLRWRRPRWISVRDDLFLKNVTAETRGRVFSVIRQCPQHWFELSTSEAQRMCEAMLRVDYQGENVIEFKPELTGKPPLPNVSMGIRVSSQEALDIALPWLLQTPAVRRFIT